MHGELAPHFAKAAQSASSVLRNYDYGAFAARLKACSVSLLFDVNAASTREGRATLDLCADLLARLFPNVDLVVIGDGGTTVSEARDELEVAMRAINPGIDISVTRRTESMATIVVGNSSVAAVTTFIGSHGWRCLISATKPVGSGDSDLPYAAGVAACVGVANAFRAVFHDHLKCDFDSELALDLRYWELNTADATMSWSPPTCADIGDTYLVGLGAIGHGFIWATSRAPALQGTLHLIDDEAYDDTNPQRYVGMPANAIGPKVSVCARYLNDSHAKLAVEPHDVTWDEFIHARGDWHLDRVLLAVDSADDRRFVQTSLPRWILNAWTQRDNVGISRHPDFTTAACVCCLYQPDGTVRDFDDVVAAALNFPDDKPSLDLVRQYLDRRLPLDTAMLDQIAAQQDLAAGALAEFEGHTLEDLYQRGVCGGMILQLGGEVGTPDRTAEVPLAFQSALAGIMLAAELYMDAVGLRAPTFPCRTEINLLKPIVGTLSSPESKHKSGRCICEDEIYRSAYIAKYLQRN